MNDWRVLTILATALAFVLSGDMGDAHAARVSKVQETVHNLSSSGPGATKAAGGGESEICVFCHTPHGADSAQTPLWNKTLANKTYTVYTSSSLDAETIRGASLEQPMGSSKLCLSCHDGAMALGSVRVLRGQANQTIAVQNTGAGGVMPGGSGTTTGYTRNLGAGVLGQTTGFDLSNDHPISLTYDQALAVRDGEMRTPAAGTQNSSISVGTHPLFGKRASGQGASRPVLPLEPTGTAGAGQVQCTTCHDPHLKETNLATESNIKFLRRPRFQLGAPGVSYNDGTDIICLACHDKGMQGAGGGSWAYSTHANASVSTQQYRSGAGSAASIRNFPDNIQVWQAACLNCHDTHTVTGSRRLLREGTSATPGTPLASGGFKAGGSSALEETCYQCHRDAAGSILANSTSVPDIRTDFNIVNGYRMPITSADQDAGGIEMHDPGSGRTGFNDGFAGGTVNGATTSGSNCSTALNDKCGADLVESRALLGTTAANRHVECTDCHNPHRVVKFKLFFGNAGNLSGSGDTQGGTHEHTDTAMTHTNVASGVLRGSWGVEPIYSSNSFHASASNYTVRRGDPGSETVGTAMPLNNAGGTVGGTAFNAMDTKGFLTREYQVCLKCHSTYGYTTPPDLRASANRRGLTPAGTVATPGVGNALTKYTDQAKEFQAPDSHASEPLSLGVDGGAGYDTNNHRSWHPVMRSTGRTATKRSINASNAFRAPWDNAVGSQTMYCSDCHGSNVTSTTSVIPDGTNTTTGAGNPWGPHGSANPFILKGTWNKDSSTGSTPLCLKCHNPTSSSGFYNSDRGNLHSYHITKGTSPLQCTWCHVAVPHGWKNKSLLVNLNDVGEEAGFPAGSSYEVAIGGNSNNYTKAPYYLEAKLKIRTFQQAGSWAETSCGTANKTGANLIANNQGSTSNSTSPVSGKDWMTNTCSNPP